MVNQQVMTATSAGVTVGLVPALQDDGLLGGLGTLGKIAIGAAVAWFAMQNSGAAWAVAFGIGLGLVIDGALDLTLGEVVPSTVMA